VRRKSTSTFAASALFAPPMIAAAKTMVSCKSPGIGEEAEGPRLVGALTPLAGKGQGSSGEFESVLEPVGEDVRFARYTRKSGRKDPSPIVSMAPTASAWQCGNQDVALGRLRPGGE
jgi:hypothetical protein